MLPAEKLALIRTLSVFCKNSHRPESASLIFDGEDFIGWKFKHGDQAVIFFSATEGQKDVEVDYDIGPLADPTDPEVRYHHGFKTYVDKIWGKITEATNGERVIFAGYSLGGAVATLAAERYAIEKGTDKIEQVITFGQPKVGDQDFADRYNRLLGKDHTRVVFKGDMITVLPLFRAQNAFGTDMDYAPVGHHAVLISAADLQTSFGLANNLHYETNPTSIALYETGLASRMADLKVTIEQFLLLDRGKQNHGLDPGVIGYIALRWLDHSRYKTLDISNLSLNPTELPMQNQMVQNSVTLP